MSLSKLQPSLAQSSVVGPSPNQPRNISFPKLSFGKAKPVQRAFNGSWFDKWGGYIGMNPLSVFSASLV